MTKVMPMGLRGLLIVPLLFWFGLGQAAEQTPMAQAVAAIKLKSSWERIELTEEPPTRYSLTLYYKPEPEVPAVAVLLAVEADTKEIARAVIAELLRQGRKPAEERISVHVFAYQGGLRGETGKALYKPFGDVFYDYYSDQLKFTQPRH
jgi:hypothetical protein